MKGEWPALIPTTALMLFAPVKTDWVPARPTPGAAGRPNPGPISHRMYTAAVGRVTTAEGTWRWQSQTYIERMYRDLETRFEVPAAWIEGESVPVRVVQPHTIFGMLGDERAEVRNGKVHIDGVIDPRVWPRRVVWRRTIIRPIRTVTDREQLIARTDDSKTTNDMLEALDPRIVHDAHGADVVLSDRSGKRAWTLPTMFISVRVRVTIGDRQVGASRDPFKFSEYPVWKDYCEVAIDWAPGGLQEVLQHPDLATIVVTGDDVGAIDWYVDAPFDREPAAWVGTFSVPVEVRTDRNTRKNTPGGRAP